MTQSNESTNTRASSQNHRKEDTDKGLLSLNSEQLLDSLFQAMQKLWLQARRIAYSIMCELGGKELIEATASWCLQHPEIAICVIAACFVFLLPLLIIFGFGIITMAVTFTGILMLEGTVLTVILMIFLACIASLAIGVALFAAIAYFGFAQIYDFLGMERHRDALIKFVQQTRSTDNSSGSARNATETGSPN